ncbi:hypothetical protein H6F86_00570 [Phormidium sp. FACHB-592]|uniref:Uncharacterized protein n=1 Tax=Stenomitos frigidus AS-A4 TaxID=2933935 RepID=A0ABV0KM35_9CYAN|nr:MULTISPECIES: hypothetical protein [Cyanophyceae]MBD2033991.1 hypothetical protein [Leptolyngbya sp. FACHB-321]MBD2072428.1 hypothetical protein [Phormidium sp. FACHB-592]
MTNVLQTHDRRLNRHQDSIMASLAHRLQVARATNNARLVALLEQEKQQVAPVRSCDVAPSPQSWWLTTVQRITQGLFGGASLQVCEVVDGSDRWWVASDPRTGQVVYADSEAEMRLWIEENYQGR